MRIPPFEVAVIKTGERINLPRFLIARWNIRVKWAYEGLLWVGGPQVDAGWVGHLLCPIYNLSDKEVTLKLGEPVAVIDFVKTTPFVKGCKEYGRPPKRLVFGDYNSENLRSALYNEARKRINDIERKVNSVGTRLDTSIGIVFAAISILVATLSILVSSREAIRVTLPGWFYLSVILSIVSLIVSLLAVTKARAKSYDVSPSNIQERVSRIEQAILILAATMILLTILVIAASIITF